MKIIRNNLRNLLFTVIGCLVFVSSYAYGSLTDQSVNGFARYCYYSDSGVITVDSSSLCPITNDTGSSPQSQASPQINKKNLNGGFGSLSGQSVNGFNRYCKYTDGAILTVDSTSLCPITDQ